MADLGIDFDPNAVEPSTYDGPLIPAGTKAMAYCTECDVIVPKSGQGKMLKFRWDIIEGPYERRVLWDQINYQHSSAQAQLIGQQRLKSICAAIGLEGPLRDTDHIMFKPLVVSIGIEKREGYEDRNVIKSFKPGNGVAAPHASAPRAATSAAPPPAAQNKPARPWGNRGA